MPSPLITLNQVSKVFGRETPVRALNTLDLKVAPGDFVAIEGPSGSGKSTLLNVITLLDSPTTGAYEIAGVDVREASRRDLAKIRSQTFGFVFQSFHLMLRRTAVENVELGLVYRGVPSARRKALAEEALRRVGLQHRVNTTCAKLSGGERQRVAIARAMVGNPPILVADEPTGSLDTANGTLIVDQLRRFHEQGTTVVMVTHDPEVANYAERRVSLRDGQIVRDATGSGRRTASAVQHTATAEGRPSTLRVSDLVRESWKALTSRPGRFAILMAAVSLAVGLVVITVGLSQTASAQVTDTFDARLNQEVTADLPPGGSVLDIGPGRTEQLARAIAGVDHAGVAEPVNSLRLARADAPSSPVDAQGYLITPGLLQAADARARWAPGHAQELGPREVLVGRLLAQDLGLGPLELDPHITVNGNAYGVAGLVEDGGRLPDMVNTLVASTGDEPLIGSPTQERVLLTTQQGAAQQVARQVAVALHPTDPNDVTVAAPVDPSTLQQDITGEVESALLALSVVALLASILGVANSMLLGVIERIGELGLRRAIGARSSHILSQSALESLLVGVLGGVLGLVLGMGAILTITILHRWSPVFDLRVAPLAVVGGALVGAVGGLPASIRASRINPADALRR